MKRWWAAHPQSFADLVFASERIDVGLKKGKFDHPTRTTEKTGANEEGEKEGETHAVTIKLRLQILFLTRERSSPRKWMRRKSCL